MKKIISLTAAVISGVVFASSTFVNAEETNYTPSCSFKIIPSTYTDNYNMITDNIVHISPEDAKNGVKLVSTVIIKDEKKLIYTTSIKWQSSDPNVKLSKLYSSKNPITDSPITFLTSDGRSFTTYSAPFTYAVINGDSEMQLQYNYTSVVDENANAMSVTYEHITANPKPFETLGATTDEFPFAIFDIEIAPGTPEGVYSVYFNTPKNTSGEFRDYCNGMCVDPETDDFYEFYADCSDLTIYVGDHVFGDVNNDKSVDAIDASRILEAYSRTSTGRSSTFNAYQNYCGDVNKDKAVDSVDASLVLNYYSKFSTGATTLSIEDYLGKR